MDIMSIPVHEHPDFLNYQINSFSKLYPDLIFIKDCKRTSRFKIRLVNCIINIPNLWGYRKSSNM